MQNQQAVCAPILHQVWAVAGYDAVRFRLVLHSQILGSGDFCSVHDKRCTYPCNNATTDHMCACASKMLGMTVRVIYLYATFIE